MVVAYINRSLSLITFVCQAAKLISIGFGVALPVGGDTDMEINGMKTWDQANATAVSVFKENMGA